MNNSNAWLLASAMAAAGAKKCFALPGTSELALARAIKESSIEYHQVLHEAAAIAMADGYSRVQKDQFPPIVITHSAQGTLNCLGMLRVAQRSRTPIIHIVGTPATFYSFRNPTHAQPGLADILRHFTSWTWQVDNASVLLEVVQYGLTVATSTNPGPVSILVPQDILEASTGSTCGAAIDVPIISVEPSRVSVSSEALRKIQELLECSRSPIALIGPGCSEQDISSIARLAEKLSLPVVLESPSRGPALLHRGLALDHPLNVGYLDRNDGALMRRLDSVDLAFCFGEIHAHRRNVGSWIESVPVVQIDREPTQLGKNHSISLGIGGPIGPVVEYLEKHLARISHNPPDDANEIVRNTRSGQHAEHLCPALFSDCLADFAGRIDVLVDDSQGLGNYTKRALHQKGVSPGMVVGPLGSHLGWGLPGAVGAALGTHSRRIVATVSDGSMALEPQALWTLSQASGANLLVLVIDNSGSMSLAMESGDFSAPYSDYPAGVLDLNLLSRSLGVASSEVRSVAELRARISDWLENGGVHVAVCKMERSPDCWSAGWFIPDAGTLSSSA